MTEEEKVEIIVVRIEVLKIDIAPTFDEYKQLFFSLASLGEVGRSLLHRVCRMHPNYSAQNCDMHFDNVLKTSVGRVSIATFYNLCKQHGVDISMPMGRPKKTDDEKKKYKADKMHEAIDYIKSHYKMRFNVWTNRTELFENEEWHPLNERDMDTIYGQIVMNYISLSNADVKSLLNNKTVIPDVDEVKDWINSLTPWQPHEGDDIANCIFEYDPIADLFDHMKMKNEKDHAGYIHFSRKWFVCMVGMALGKLEVNPLMIMFVGKQHSGKTYFPSIILPPDMRKYFDGKQLPTWADKDFRITLTEVLVFMLDELSFEDNKQYDYCKSLITQRKNRDRDAFGHNREDRPKKASFIGNTNHVRFIKDEEGSRRFYPVEVNGYVNINDKPIDYEGAFSMAVYLLNNGFNPEPTSEESEQITERNRDYMEPNDVAEVLKTYFRKPFPEGECQAMSSAQILQVIQNLGFRGKAYNTTAIGRALVKLGYEYRTVHKQNMYLIAKIDPTILEANNKYDGNIIREMIREENEKHKQV